MTDRQLKVFREELQKQAAYWQRNQHDPYNIRNAVQASLAEVSNAISTAIEAGGEDVKSCCNQVPVITVDRLKLLITEWGKQFASARSYSAQVYREKEKQFYAGQASVLAACLNDLDAVLKEVGK